MARPPAKVSVALPVLKVAAVLSTTVPLKVSAWLLVLMLPRTVAVVPAAWLTLLPRRSSAPVPVSMAPSVSAPAVYTATAFAPLLVMESRPPKLLLLVV